MPVMEGKALLFKKFAGINAVPVCIDVTDVDDVVRVVAALAPSFGGINLEDISAPRCFEIEDRLRAMLDIPVIHDDQHGTAIVALAALRSAARVVGKELRRHAGRGLRAPARPGSRCRRSCSRPASARSAVADSKGMIYHGRDGLNPVKAALADGDQRLRATPARRRRRCAARTCSSGCPAAPCPRRPSSRMAPGAIAFLLSNPEPGGPPGRRPPPRGRGGDRAQRLPEPDQQLAGVPRRLPRRPGRPGDHDHGEHEAGRRRRARRPGRRRRRRRTTSSRASSTSGSPRPSPPRSPPRPAPTEWPAAVEPRGPTRR